MDIDVLLYDGAKSAGEKITELKKKHIKVPDWEGALKKEYDPKLHPVMTDPNYRDRIKKDQVVKVSRVIIGFQKLASKRMTSMMFAIPVKRVYTYTNEESGKKAVDILEKILEKNRIDSQNIKRFKMYFAACEIATLWYTKKEKDPHTDYGEQTIYKLRQRTFSPFQGEKIYPYFDEFNDLTALSFEYSREEDEKTINYFDVYTSSTHVRYKQTGSNWEQDSEPERIDSGKIPGSYIHRLEPIWEDTSTNIYEQEWSLSRSGNYLRKNSKPVFATFSDKKVKAGGEESSNDEDRAVMRFAKGDDAKYVPWEQAIESLRYYNDTLYRQAFTQIQLPDMSFDNMKANPMSGEAREMMFIDAHLKVNDEQGDIIEFLDREIRVIKSLMIIMFPNLKDAINDLAVKHIITPYTVKAEKEKIDNIATAVTGGFLSTEKAVEAAEFVQPSEIQEEVAKIRADKELNVNGAYGAGV